mmetsp:Transcript_27349/g.47226  ORF Transcript_27349/g.47226 Transcript_27349/m.47226 type:complete len:248 (-) Transcript_27349:462-1205(-)
MRRSYRLKDNLSLSLSLCFPLEKSWSCLSGAVSVVQTQDGCVAEHRARLVLRVVALSRLALSEGLVNVVDGRGALGPAGDVVPSEPRVWVSCREVLLAMDVVLLVVQVRYVLDFAVAPLHHFPLSESVHDIVNVGRARLVGRLPPPVRAAVERVVHVPVAPQRRILLIVHVRQVHTRPPILDRIALLEPFHDVVKRAGGDRTRLDSAERAPLASITPPRRVLGLLPVFKLGAIELLLVVVSQGRRVV